MKRSLLSLVGISLSFLYCFGAEPLSIVQINSTPAGCNIGQFPGMLSLRIAGGTPPYFYTINGGNPPTEVTGNQITFKGNPDQYRFVITDSGNPQQSVSSTSSIKFGPLISITSVSVQNNTCSNNANGRIIIQAEGGTLPLSYSVKGAFVPSNIFSNLESDIYNIRVQDAGRCPTAQASVQVLPTIVRFITHFTVPTSNGGSDGSITISVQQANRIGGVPPFQFSIDNGMHFLPGDTPTSKLFSGLTAGTYSPFVRDANGCLYPVDPITIPEPNGFAIDLMVSNVTTEGGSDGQIIAIPNQLSPGILYSLNGGTLQASPLFKGLSEGTYKVGACLGKECAVATGVIITEANILSFTTTILKQPSCKTGALGSLLVNAIGGTVPYAYSIDAGKTFQTSPIFEGLAAGEYTIVVRDALGTTVTHTVAVGIVIKLTGNPITDCVIRKCCKRSFKNSEDCITFIG